MFIQSHSHYTVTRGVRLETHFLYHAAVHESRLDLQNASQFAMFRVEGALLVVFQFDLLRFVRSAHFWLMGVKIIGRMLITCHYC